ncbi:MAG TPA: PQQ-binding-like beta-propeller repeat protein, partial [Phycisphaerae bacterium]|nr:PQQ-binding-like beta-propeller repeat protein [Phycisphaerae bacterium]
GGNAVVRMQVNGGPFNLLGTGADSDPVVAGGTIYQGGSDGLAALDSTTGNEVWKYKTDQPVAAPPVVADGVIYFVTGTVGGMFRMPANAPAQPQPQAANEAVLHALRLKVEP